MKRRHAVTRAQTAQLNRIRDSVIHVSNDNYYHYTSKSNYDISSTDGNRITIGTMRGADQPQ